MKKILVLICIVLTQFSVFKLKAQSCGTPIPVNPTVYSSSATARGASSAHCIDVFYHIVRNTNGTNAFSPNNLDDITDDLNEFFSPHDIIINNAGSDFIDNSDFVNIGSENEAATLGQTNNRSGAINYYIVSTLWNTASGSTVLGTANSIPSNNLVIRNDATFTSTSPHEFGHCLNLLHTHQGTAGGSGCAEAIDGSNCDSCGDLICDTPADNGTGVSGGFNPDLTNMMSYYRPRDHFTNEQGTRMRTAIEQESLFDDLTSLACVSISQVNNICFSESTTITLSNLGGATTAWTSSSNVEIISSNNTSATFQPVSGSSQEEGWIRANLNNMIELTEEFWIGNVQFDAGELSGPSTLYVGSDGYYQAPEAQGENYYQWTFPNGGFNIIAGQGKTTARIEAKSTGMKVIELRAYNNCGYRYKYIYVNVKSSSSGGGGSEPCPSTLSVFPNPTTKGDIEARVIYPGDGGGGGDYPCISRTSSSSKGDSSSNSESLQDGLFIITDQFGEVVYEKKHKGKKVKLKLHKLNQGIYTIHYLFNNQELLYAKFIKQ